MLLETGAGSMDRVELSRHIGTHTGGVYCTSMVGQKQGKGGVIASIDDVLGYLFLRYSVLKHTLPYATRSTVYCSSIHTVKAMRARSVRC
jgi:hypothetical protein